MELATVTMNPVTVTMELATATMNLATATMELATATINPEAATITRYLQTSVTHYHHAQGIKNQTKQKINQL